MGFDPRKAFPPVLVIDDIVRSSLDSLDGSSARIQGQMAPKTTPPPACSRYALDRPVDPGITKVLAAPELLHANSRYAQTLFRNGHGSIQRLDRRRAMHALD
jgi:hypothetical protein